MQGNYWFKKHSSIALQIATVVVVLIAAIAPKVQAASGAGTITISPFLTETQVRPADASKDVSINLTNSTRSPQNFDISAVDFGSLNDTGGIAFAGGDSKEFTQKYGLARWLHLPVDHLTLAAGQTTKLQATIANDDTLGPGGHYAAIIMSVDGHTGDNADSVNIQQKISALVFATKVGGEVYDMRLSKIVDDGSFAHLPSIFTITFANTGNVHLVPRGTLKLIAPNGTVVSKGVINEGSAYVLPETSRQIVVQTTRASRSGWMPGNYKVQVDYRYDGRAQFATKTYSFKYFNVVGIAWFVLVAGIGVYLGIKYRIWRYAPLVARRSRRLLRRA